jgi:hypothetical protein
MSDDSSLDPSDLIEQAKMTGLDAICFTDHDRFWEMDEIETLSKKHNFTVIPGCEINTEEGHLLVFGLTRYVFGMHRASVVKGMVDRSGGVMFVAHPYRRMYWKDMHTGPGPYCEMVDRACRNKVFGMVDAIDVMNGRGTDEENAFSREIARRFNKKGIGASDAHKLDDVGRYATEFERSVTCLNDFIEEVKAGRFRPVDLSGRTAAK